MSLFKTWLTLCRRKHCLECQSIKLLTMITSTSSQRTEKLIKSKKLLIFKSIWTRSKIIQVRPPITKPRTGRVIIPQEPANFSGKSVKLLQVRLWKRNLLLDLVTTKLILLNTCWHRKVRSLAITSQKILESLIFKNNAIFMIQKCYPTTRETKLSSIMIKCLKSWGKSHRRWVSRRTCQDSRSWKKSPRITDWRLMKPTKNLKYQTGIQASLSGSLMV